MNIPTPYLFLASTGEPAAEHVAVASEDVHADDSSHSETAEHTADASHGEEAGGLSSFGLDPIAFAFQLGAIIIFYILFRKFALKKVVSVLDERHNTIEKSLADAEQISKDVALAQEKQAALIAEARTEANVILADATKEAGAIVKAAEIRAGKKVDTMITDAHSRIADDVAKAKKDLEGEVAALVAEATEVIIGEKLDAKKDAALIKKALAGQK